MALFRNVTLMHGSERGRGGEGRGRTLLSLLWLCVMQKDSLKPCNFLCLQLLNQFKIHCTWYTGYLKVLCVISLSVAN